MSVILVYLDILFSSSDEFVPVLLLIIDAILQALYLQFWLTDNKTRGLLLFL